MTSPTFTLVHEIATPRGLLCTRTSTGFAATRSTPRRAGWAFASGGPRGRSCSSNGARTRSTPSAETRSSRVAGDRRRARAATASLSGPRGADLSAPAPRWYRLSVDGGQTPTLHGAARDGRHCGARRVRACVRDAPGTAAKPPAPRAAAPVDARTPSSSSTPAASRLTVRSRDGAVSRDVDLALVVDGASAPARAGPRRPRRRPTASTRRCPSPIGDTTVDAELELRVDLERDDAVGVELTAPPDADTAGHTRSRSAPSSSSDGQVVFVPGVGQIADRATVTGGALVVDAEPHPIAIVSTAAP